MKRVESRGFREHGKPSVIGFWKGFRFCSKLMHHRLHGHEFEQAPGVGDEQGGLACGGPWGRKQSDTTEGLN